MENFVLVRYGEITLKSEPVRREFERILVNNMKKKLENYRKIRQERGRIFIETNRSGEVASSVAELPGVVSTSPVLRTDADIGQITKLAKKVAEKSIELGQSFAVRARRVGEHDFSSKDLEEEVGRLILENLKNTSVDLDSPDQEVHIEVRNEDAYIFSEIFPGVGGLPVGSQGKAVSLFQGDINSLLSSFLLLKRGSPVSLLFPVTDEVHSKDQVIEMAEQLLKYHPNLKLHFLSLRELIGEISENIPRDLRWVIFRRSLLRISEEVAREEEAKAIAISEDLDETAQNTLKTARLIEEGIELPVLRPLFGFSSDEVLDMGGEMNIEVPNGKLSQTPWTPEKSKKVDSEKIKRMEESIPVNSFIESALESMETLELGE